MSSKALKQKKVVSDFLTEDEIRAIIKSRIEEQTKMNIGTVGSLVLYSDNFENNIDKPLLNEGILDTIVTSIMGQNADTWATALKITTMVVGFIIGGTSSWAVGMMPFIPVWAKIMIIGAIKGSCFYAYKKMSEAIDNLTVMQSYALLFLNNEKNPINKIVSDLNNEIQTGFSGTGGLQMPDLSLMSPPIDPFDPSDNPAECKKHLETYLAGHGTPTDFLGIPQADFAQNSLNSPPAISAAHTGIKGFGFESRRAFHNTTASAMFTEIMTAGPNMTDRVLSKLSAAMNDPEFTLYDLQWIDFRFGKRVRDAIGNGTIQANGGVAAFTAIERVKAIDATGLKRSGIFFCADASDLETTVLNDPAVSNIIGCMSELNTYGNKLRKTLGTVAFAPIQKASIAATGTSADTGFDFFLLEMRKKIDLSTYQQASVFRLETVLDPGALEPYLLGRDYAEITPHLKVGATGTSIGRGFFKALEPTITEKVKAFFTNIWDKTKAAVVSAWNWTKTQAQAFYSWIEPKITAFFTAIASGLAATWAWFTGFITDFKNWVLGLFDSGGGGGTTVTPSRRSRYRGSSRYYTEVEQMQALMNDINEREGLGAPGIEEDGYWGPRTDEMWEVIINYGFQPGGIFDDDPDQSRYDDGFYYWPGMSDKLRDDDGTRYPGYTSDPRGALNIVADIEAGNTDFGLGRSRRNRSPAGAGTVSDDSQRGPVTAGETQRASDRTSGRGISGVRISVDSGNNDINTLEELGFNAGTTRNVSEEVVRAIRSVNYTGTGSEGIKLKVHFNRRGVVKRIGLAGTQSVFDMANFKGLRRGIRRILNSSGPIEQMASGETVDTRLRRRASGRSRGTFILIITIPAGAKKRR